MHKRELIRARYNTDLSIASSSIQTKGPGISFNPPCEWCRRHIGRKKCYRTDLRNIELKCRPNLAMITDYSGVSETFTGSTFWRNESGTRKRKLSKQIQTMCKVTRHFSTLVAFLHVVPQIPVLGIRRLPPFRGRMTWFRGRMPWSRGRHDLIYGRHDLIYGRHDLIYGTSLLPIGSSN